MLIPVLAAQGWAQAGRRLWGAVCVRRQRRAGWNKSSGRWNAPKVTVRKPALSCAFFKSSCSDTAVDLVRELLGSTLGRVAGSHPPHTVSPPTGRKRGWYGRERTQKRVD